MTTFTVNSPPAPHRPNATRCRADSTDFPSAVVDLAQGHVDALRALPKDEIFTPSPDAAESGFGGSGGKYKMYNLGKGKGLSVLDMVKAMEKATGFKFEAEIVGRR